MLHFNELTMLMDLLMKGENNYEYISKEFKNRKKDDHNYKNNLFGFQLPK